MKPRTLLIFALLSAMPSRVLAQGLPAPSNADTAQVAPAPKAAKAPRAALAPAPMTSAVEVPPTPPAPELLQVPPVPKIPPVLPTPALAPAAAPAPPAPPRPMGQMINVRIDVTLSDSLGKPRTLTMTVADGESGMNRTANVGPADYSFNADAAPTVVGNKIRLRLTADAVVPLVGGEGEKGEKGEKGARLGLRQSQTVILNDGDSVEIARAADPVSDRAFVLSVKVKIQR